MKLRHICKVCGREEILTPEEAFEAGWDYPPKMGSFGILSPRTCPNCLINQTVWWEIVAEGKDPNSLSGEKKTVIERILQEPESVLVEA